MATSGRGSSPKEEVWEELNRLLDQSQDTLGQALSLCGKNGLWKQLQPLLEVHQQLSCVRRYKPSRRLAKGLDMCALEKT